jgi:hypothetical protein
MNLLVNGDTSSTSSDDCEGAEQRRAATTGASKRRALQQVNGRPRSFSVRTASITKEEKSAANKGK